MRKKIALFANGWSGEFLQEIGQGIRLVASRANVDVFAFVNYTIHAESEENRLGEFNIFKLPDMSQFDGIMALAGTFNMQIEIEYIHKEILRTGIPAITLEYKLDGVDAFCTDDYTGMYDLTEHLIVDHEVKDILYIAGLEEHEGSNIRLKAVKKCAESHGISIANRNIIYGNFSAAPAVEAFEKWFAENDNMLPEAIVCANDIMAIGICDWLKDHGISVPGDVKVTGFDCLKSARDNDPSIASVSREWVNLGTKSFERLLKKIDGETVPAYEELSTSFVSGESCGCSFEDTYLNGKLKRVISPRKVIDGFSCDQHFRHMYLAMRKNGTAEQVHDSLSAFFLKEGWLEGERLMLAIHPNFFVSDNWDSIRMEGFPEEMDIVCYIHNKKSEPISKMKTMDAVFSIANNTETAGIYICVPVRVDEISVGFAILSKGFSLFQNDILYLWCRHMSQYTEQVKSNVMIDQLTKRLEALSVTDALTGVYNRTGCETIMYPAVDLNQQLNGQSVIMIADLDRLKRINDTFGHAVGDIALRAAVKSLRNALPSNYMIGRFGGDELLVIGTEKETIDINGLLAKIDESIKLEASKQTINFNLSLSIGAIQLMPGEKFDIVNCIERADKIMYETKEQHHQFIDNCTKGDN